MLQLKIDPSKQQTIKNLLHETFPAIECYNNEKLHAINPKPELVAYIHALVINCILMAFEDSINSRALEHEGAMVDVYSKMKPDAFRLQLQTVLLRGHQGDDERQRLHQVQGSQAKFADQDDTGLAPDAADADPADPADANAASPASRAATPPDGSAAAAPDGEGPPPAPSPGGKGGGGKAGRAGGGSRKVGKAQA
jgi:hypothetical protein